jgi:glycosyltransferase involved in cell wall biosynthesis
MKISSLHFCTSDSWGGLELYACTLMSELKKAGVNVFAVCKSKSKIEKYLIDHEVPYSCIPSSFLISLSSIRFLRSLIRQQRANVVHVHFHKDIWVASPALILNKKIKLFISIYMGVGAKNDLLHKIIFKRLNGIFTSSPELNSKLHHLYPVPSNKIHLFPYGRILKDYKIDIEKRNAIRKQHNVNPHDILVGTMVRIDPGKGVRDFIESFIHLKKHSQNKVKYIVVGEPTRKGHVKSNASPFESHCQEYHKQIQDFISKNKLEKKIICAGFQKDIIGYLSAMDIFVFPSRDEMYSLVMLDAMAIGLPIVAAGSGGNLLQVNHGINGLLYETANSADMAQKIETYIENPDLMKEHKEEARKFVEDNHDMKKCIEQLINHYMSPN